MEGKEKGLEQFRIRVVYREWVLMGKGFVRAFGCGMSYSLLRVAENIRKDLWKDNTVTRIPFL